MDLVPPTITYASTSDLAGDLARESRGSVPERLHAVPYSRYDPESTIWWLVPEPLPREQVYFRVGKLIVHPRQPYAPDDGLLVGLHMEKGVQGEQFAKSLRMGPDWRWHEFREALRSGAISDRAAAAEAVAGRSLTVAVAASVETGAPGLADYGVYSWSDGRMVAVASKSPLGVMDDPSACTSLEALADLVGGIRQPDYVWAEVIIGVRLRRAEVGEWSPRDVWQRVCDPWSPWLG